MEEKTVTEVLKNIYPPGHGSCWYTSVQNFCFSQYVLFAVSNEQCSFQIDAMNNHKNTERRAQAHGPGRPYYVILLNFCITRTEGSK